MITKLTSGAIYRHKNCLDMDVYVVKVQFDGSSQTQFRCWLIDRNENVLETNYDTQILKKDFHLWKRVK